MGVMLRCRIMLVSFAFPVSGLIGPDLGACTDLGGSGAVVMASVIKSV
jgi:hypothetical protein